MSESTTRRGASNVGAYAPPPLGQNPDTPPVWRKWGEIVALALGIVGLLSLSANALGIRLTGSPEDVAALARRVVKLEDASLTSSDRLGRVESALRFQSYLVCVQLRRSDPNAVPPDCTPIIQSRGAP